MTDMLAASLSLAQRGMTVFPVFGVLKIGDSTRCQCGKSDCARPAKHPVGALVRNGLRDATRDPAIISKWWYARDWNIGVALPARVMVLDVDPRHGGEATLAALEAQHGALPETWRAFTGGGGEHVFLGLPSGVSVKNSAGALGLGLDVRTAGGYIVAPPSLHICGVRYAWNVDCHPEDTQLAEAPAWLTDLCNRASGPTGKSAFAAHIGEPVGEGARNSTLTSLTGHLLRHFVDPHVAFDLVSAWNQVRCRPPLASNELKKIVNSIASRELRRREARR